MGGMHVRRFSSTGPASPARRHGPPSESEHGKSEIRSHRRAKCANENMVRVRAREGWLVAERGGGFVGEGFDAVRVCTAAS